MRQGQLLVSILRAKTFWLFIQDLTGNSESLNASLCSRVCPWSLVLLGPGEERVGLVSGKRQTWVPAVYLCY